MSILLSSAADRSKIDEITKTESGKRIVIKTHPPLDGEARFEVQILNEDGSRYRNYLLGPAKISPSDCRANLELLSADAEYSGFTDLKLNPKACDGNDRKKAVDRSK